MTFRVGQKVIRVGGASAGVMKVPAGFQHSFPELGEIVTIKTLNAWATGTLLTFHEHDNSHIQRELKSRYEPGFSAEAFRPLVGRKTDISIFTAMLKPSKVRA